MQIELPDGVAKALYDVLKAKFITSEKFVSVVRVEHDEPIDGETPLNEKQYTAVLNLGMSHGLALGECFRMVNEKFSVSSIRELQQKHFAAALELMRGPESQSPTVPKEQKDFQTAAEKQTDAKPINSTQWCDLLNAGTSEGMSVEAVNAFILERYGCKTRALPSGKYEEAVAALKAVRV